MLPSHDHPEAKQLGVKGGDLIDFMQDRVQMTSIVAVGA